MIKIAILGLGTVGTGVVKVVEANTAPIQHKLGQPLSVKTALVRKLRADPYQHLMTENFREIEHDGEIRVVVETIGGVEAAYEYTRRCLMAGKHVVTANKQLVAEHGCELLDLARKNHVNYLFEASVGGGIPVLHPLTQCMAANRVDEIYGILNGTTNFILTKMVKEGASFAEVLKLAQEKGYAEADPTADVEGIDAGRKICILADLAFGHQVDPAQVPMEGITGIDLKDVEIAGRHGYRIKLLGRCLRLEGGRRTAYVAPHLISEENPMSDVNDVFNAVVVRGNATGEVMFYGKGAGKLPTASAVVADVIDALKEGVKVHDSLFWKPAEKPEGLLEDRNTYPWYLRVTGVAAALLPSVAGAGHVVFEDNGEAAYLVDAATSADIAAVTEKIEVLGGKVALAMKKLEG